MSSQTTDRAAEGSYKSFGQGYRMGETRTSEGARLLIIQAKQPDGTWKTVFRLDQSGNMDITASVGASIDMTDTDRGSLP